MQIESSDTSLRFLALIFEVLQVFYGDIPKNVEFHKKRARTNLTCCEVLKSKKKIYRAHTSCRQNIMREKWKLLSQWFWHKKYGEKSCHFFQILGAVLHLQANPIWPFLSGIGLDWLRHYSSSFLRDLSCPIFHE